jgi:competence protein ComGC
LKTTGPGRNSRYFRSASGYGIVETLLVIIIISALAMFLLAKYEKNVTEARKTALKTELGNIRQTITFFRITRGRIPLSLNELLETKVIFPHADMSEKIFRNSYLEHMAMDEKKRLLDPFGMPYFYDAGTGYVRSTCKEFESW